MNNMKITKVEPIMTGWRRIFVRITTDEGITGVGEGGNWGFRESVAGAVHRMEEPLLGQDPLCIEYLDAELYNRFKFGGTSVCSAISAIDVALWDIKGKYFNLPVYQMLGGAVRKKIRLWGVVSGKNIPASVECALRLKEEGYDCIRLNPTNIEEAVGSYAMRLDAMSRMIHEVRAAAGKEVDIGCEIHRSLQPHESIELMRMVEDVHLLFFEDPINYENYQTLQSVCRKAQAPIGVGERSFCIQDVDMLLKEDQIAFLRPDVAVMGGLTGCKKACAIAESHYVNVIPHIATGSVCVAASLALAASIPNFEVMEMCPAPGEWPKIQEEITEPFVIEKGHMLLKEGPGIGVTLRDDILETAPYREWKWNLNYNEYK
jgi:galactonate dehydratase